MRVRSKGESDFRLFLLRPDAYPDVADEHAGVPVRDANLTPLSRLEQGDRAHGLQKRQGLRIGPWGPALVSADFRIVPVGLKRLQVGGGKPPQDDSLSIPGE